MRVQRMTLALFACVFAIFLRSARAEETAKVIITITVPKDTDEKATLYLAGSLKEVGDWKADGVKLSRQPDGTYKFEKNLPKGQTLEYKINGGDWDTVEKGEHGEEVDNRTLKIDGDKDEKITVKGWASKPGAGGGAKKDEKKSTITGNVRVHDHFASRILSNDRTILVWLPPEYQANANARFPVLYLHD